MSKSFFLRGLLIISLCLASFPGCSLLTPHNEIMTIITEPPGATVDIEGVHYTSPAQPKVRRNRTFNVYVEKDGYLPQKAWCGRTLSNTGTLDLMGAVVFYLPVLGFLSPGAWKHEQKYLKFYLQKQEMCPECAAKKTLKGW